ncbi:MAG: hypothetical protein EB084_22815 [Proteobacteria bacterium]|nr:hypothetical protein [Pseudomonadota bacterium]
MSRRPWKRAAAALTLSWLLAARPSPALDIIFSEGAAISPVREAGGAPAPPAATPSASPTSSQGESPTAVPAQQATTPGQPAGPKAVTVNLHPYFTTTNVWGDGARSFQANGLLNRQDVTVDLQLSGQNNHYATGQVFTRYTDDPMLYGGGGHVKVPGFFIEYGQRDRFDLRAGNLPVQFSTLSFSRQVDGLQGRFFFPDATGVWGVKGVAARMNNGQNGVSYRKFVYGLRLEREFRPGPTNPVEHATAGLNAVLTHDDQSSISMYDGVPFTASSLYSIDTQIAFRGGLALDGEYATSIVSTSGSYTGPTLVTGSGGRLSLRQSAGPWNAGATIERYSPSFTSLTGSASADLYRTDAYLGYAFGQEVRVDLSLQNNHNNVSRQLLTTFKSMNQRVGLTLRPFASSKDMALQPLFFNVGFNTFDAVDPATTNRLTRQWLASSGYSFGPAAVTYSYQDQNLVDRLVPTLNRDDATHTAQVSYRIPIGKRDSRVAVTPSIGATFTKSYDPSTSLNSPTDNMVYGLTAELGNEWRLGFAQTVNQSIRPEASIGWRSTLQVTRRAEVSYRPQHAPDTQISLEWNDRSYADSLPGYGYGNNQFILQGQTRF